MSSRFCSRLRTRPPYVINSPVYFINPSFFSVLGAILILPWCLVILSAFALAYCFNSNCFTSQARCFRAFRRVMNATYEWALIAIDKSVSRVWSRHQAFRKKMESCDIISFKRVFRHFNFLILLKFWAFYERVWCSSLQLWYSFYLKLMRLSDLYWRSFFLWNLLHVLCRLTLHFFATLTLNSSHLTFNL